MADLNKEKELCKLLLKYEKYKLRSIAMPEWEEEMRDAAVDAAELALSIWEDKIVFNYHGMEVKPDEYFRLIDQFGD